MVDLTPELNYPASSNFSYSLHVATGPTNRMSTAEETMMKKLFVASLILSLSGAVFAAEPTAQQSKMKTCNADAAGKKGDERKAFMKECLSAKPAAPEPKLTQQDKMKKCNADATGKKGDERKAFMKTCLSNKS